MRARHRQSCTLSAVRARHRNGRGMQEPFPSAPANDLAILPNHCDFRSMVRVVMLPCGDDPDRAALRLLPYLALVLFALSGCRAEDPRIGTTWTSLLTPYAPGREVARGYVLDAPRRGNEHDVTFRAVRPGDHAQVTVHVLDRGRWQGVRETRSFGIAWEAPHTTAPREDAEAVTEALARALRAHDPGRGPVDAIPLASFAPPSPPWMRALALMHPFGTWRTVPWWLFAAACVAAGCWRRLRPARDDLALAASALAVRVALGAWGPFHVNGQGPLWIDGAQHPEELRAYGPGWTELQGPLAWLLSPDHGVFMLNLLLSAAIPALVAAVARRVGLGRGSALAAGALAVGDPVLVRIATTESYFTAITALTVASVWCFVAAAPINDRRTWALLRLAGALSAVACARVHPLSYLPLLLVPLIVGAGAGLREALWTAVSIGLAVALTSGCVLADVATSVAHGSTAPPVWWWLAPAWAMLAGLVALAFHPRARRLVPALAASMVLGGFVAATYHQSAVWQQAALRVVALPVLLTAASLLPDAWTSTARRAGALSVALALGGLLAGRTIVRSRTTDDDEYTWARRWLLTAPPLCRVTWVAFVGPRRTVFLPTWVHRGPSVRLDARGPLNVGPLLEPLGCTWYIRTTACDTTDGGPACAAVERYLTLSPVASAAFPARASHAGLPYPRATVRTAVFRVVGLSPSPM